MAWESFEKEQTERREKVVKNLVERLLTNGQNQKGNRLVIYNDNAYKYHDLGGWGKAVLRDKFLALYDQAFKDGMKHQKSQGK